METKRQGSWMREDTMKAKAWENPDIGKWFHLWSNTLTVALLCCSNRHYMTIRLIWREVKTFVTFHWPGELVIIPALTHLLDHFHDPSPTRKYLTELLAFLVLNLSSSLQSSDQLSSKSPFAVGRETTRGLPPESSKAKWLKLKQFTYMIGSGLSWVCLVLLFYQRWRRRIKTPFGHSEFHC